MNISETLLHDKFRELRPDLASTMDPSVLKELCSDSDLQPFLRWFFINISRTNVLTKEEEEINKDLKTSGEWLNGDDLDIAFDEACKEHPEIADIVILDDYDLLDLYRENETANVVIKENKDYIEFLKDSIMNLTHIEDEIDEIIEQKNIQLEKEEIIVNQLYGNCNESLENFDKINKSFFKDMKQLLEVYADASGNKGLPVLWSMLPTHLLSKDMELYFDYLQLYLKQKFNNVENDETRCDDSDFEILVDQSREKQADEKIQELIFCTNRLVTSTYDESAVIVEEECMRAMLKKATEIYNDGILNIPPKSDLPNEIIRLTRNRDYLEDNISLLEKQLREAALQFAEYEKTKVLLRDAQSRLIRRNITYSRLQDLLKFSRDMGHANSDLLCILMGLQTENLHKAANFISDALNYLSSEYSLSLLRCKDMNQLQEEFIALKSSVNSYPFNKSFSSIMLDEETTTDLMTSCIEKLCTTVKDNENCINRILGISLNQRMEPLKSLNQEIMNIYNNELKDSPTCYFQPIEREILVLQNDISSNVCELKEESLKMRSDLRDFMNNCKSMERERLILWQKFLTDPESVIDLYKVTSSDVDKAHFGN